MKILVDENIPFADETFGQHGEIVRFSGRTVSPADLQSVDALITRSVTQVKSELLSRHKPKFVGTCTIGTDHLDIDFLEASNIAWAYAPGCNAQSVVDYVLSVIATLLGDAIPTSVGIVGCGNVGGCLRSRLLEMGCNVRVYDPFLIEDQLCADQLSENQMLQHGSLEQVFKSDLVCLHTPYTDSGNYPTKHMIGFDELSQLPENALVVSAGRGGVIREGELLDFMTQRSDVRVALDVWQDEPVVNADLLASVSIATPHIAGYSLEGKRRGTLQIYRSFCEAFSLDAQIPEQLADASLAAPIEHVFDALLGVYDPKTDTNRMRDAYVAASDESRASGVWFDRLRRQYPERREIASIKLGLVAKELRQSLSHRGFVLAD